MAKFTPRWRLLAGAALLALGLPALAQSGGTTHATTPGTTPRTTPGTTSATPGTTPGAVTNGTGAMPMPHGIVPNRSELPMSAFNKLDNGNKGYVTRDDVTQLAGFESAFVQADQNHDGRLNASEFNSAWAIFTGQNP